MANISEYISKIKTAIYGKDVRGSLADGLDAVNKETEAATALTQETEQRQTSLEKQFDDQIANMTLDDPSSAELVAARTNVNTGESYDTIGRRLDAEHAGVTSQLADLERRKADQSFVDIQFANIVSGSPRGTYTNLSALQSAYPDGTDGVFLVLENGHWYYWNGSAWEDGGEYIADPLGAEGVTDEKIKKFDIKPNRLYNAQIYNVFNKDTALVNKRITYSDVNGAVIVDDEGWAVSDYEAVNPGETYTVRKSVATGASVAVFYDSNKKAIGDVKATGNYVLTTFTVPVNAYFMRVNVILDVGIDTEMIAVGSTYPPKYYPYQKAKLPWLDLDEYDEQFEELEKQKQDRYYLTARTTDTSIEYIKFNQNFYGYMNLFKNPSEPIHRIRVWTNVTTAGTEYKCRIRSANRVVLYTTTKTPTTTGWQWVEFTFDGVVIPEEYIYVEVASLNKMSAIASGATLSSDAAASDTYKNYYCYNTNLESYYTVNPANSYYMVIEIENKQSYVIPPEKSITSAMLTDELKEELKNNGDRVDLSLFIPKKVFTWGDGINGDWDGFRVPRVGLYLDHMIPWGTPTDYLKGIKFDGVSQKNRLTLTTPYPIDWSLANVNNALSKQEITKTFKIMGDNINDIESSITQVSVRNDVGEDTFVALLTIGDSTVEGANAFITLEDGTQIWSPFWHEVAKQFAMDQIAAGDNNKYKFVSLGTREGKGGADTVTYKGQTKNIITATGGESGSKLADHLRYVTQKRPSQETWDSLGLGDGSGTDYKGTPEQKDLIAQTCEVYTGTEEDFTGNPFFDQSKTGNNRFSIAKWLERYRTMDDSGNRLSLGSGTGTKITADNINKINVCTPTHVLLQTGLNDWSQVSVEQYLADMDIFVSEIKTQLPNAKIAITLFADDPGTFFRELYPDIMDSDMRYLHDRTRPYITALFEHFGDSTDVELLPFYFVMPPAISLSYRWVQNDDGRKVKVPFGPASNDYHSNGYAHRAWAHQLYAWLKYTLA